MNDPATPAADDPGPHALADGLAVASSRYDPSMSPQGGRLAFTEAERAGVVGYVEHEVEDIGYVPQKVRHAELVRRERLFGDMYEVWDVHTNKGRWWVISPPMDLYPQGRNKSMDEALSLHVGLSFRISERDGGRWDDAEPRSEAWRRQRDASELLKVAEEAIDFQAVGVACREALLALVREESADLRTSIVDPPQEANFLEWSKLLAAHLVPGPSRRELRAHLRECARTSWVSAGWLVHARDAALWDAEMVLQGVGDVIAAYGLAKHAKKQGRPETCPECGSYRRSVEFINGKDASEGLADVCLACDWSAVRPDTLNGGAVT